MRTSQTQRSGKAAVNLRRFVVLLLTLIVMPIGFICVFLILLPVCIWNGAMWCIYWLRWKLYGIPLPPKGQTRDEWERQSEDQMEG